MWNTIKSISSLLLSYGMLLLGNGMISILLGLRSRLEGFSTEITGFIMAGFFVLERLSSSFQMETARTGNCDIRSTPYLANSNLWPFRV